MCSKVSLPDRFLRVFLGLMLGLVPLFHGAAIFDVATVSIAIMCVGVALLVTGVIGICPIYWLLGFKKDQPC